jgi:hypothetical protein
MIKQYCQAFLEAEFIACNNLSINPFGTYGLANLVSLRNMQKHYSFSYLDFSLYYIFKPCKILATLNKYIKENI